MQAVDGTAGRLSVTRRCADLTELLAAAEAGLGRVALISADLPMLDREAVAALHRCGVRVVGLGDPAIGWQTERAVALGVDLVVDAPEDGADVAAFVRSVMALLERGAATSPETGDLPEDPLPQAGPGPGFTPPANPTRPRERGRVVAVWGPTGAPGRTTVALNLAAEIALLGHAALLVDADTYGGTIAQSVGLLDESPGIAAAARAAGQGTLDLDQLARLTPLLAPDLRVLSGISRADRWPELASASLEVVWTVARALSAWTVVDCGFSLEQDEALSYDTHAPRRNAATLSALHEADEVVVVGAGDPIGVQRLVRALGELAELGLSARRTVVVNKVRSSVAGPRPGEAVTGALERYAGVAAPVLVPDDRTALDAALLEARLLHELVPGSPARRALASLALHVVGAPAGATTREGDGDAAGVAVRPADRRAARLAEA